MFDNPFLTFQGFSQFLGVNSKAITYFGYTRKGRRNAYRKFSLSKRGGGTRTIRAPARGLYIVQRAILDKVLTADNLRNRHCVYSYTPERCAQDMAARHVAREFVVRIDLVDFFGSITFPRVLGALKAFPLKIPHNWAVIIAQLCVCENGLPQGAPTSPAISNLIARRMDGELIQFAKKHGFRYSRYSDDLVFSGKTRRNLSALVELDSRTFSYVAAEPIRSIIESNNFRVNSSKTRVAFRNQKQIVVGSIVNKKVNVDRKYVRQIRTLLHLAKKSPSDALEAHHKWSGRHHSKEISAVIRGKIEYVRSLKGSSDTVFTTLAESFNYIFDAEKPIDITHLLASKAGRYADNHVLVCQGFHKKYNDASLGSVDEAVLYRTGSCFFLEGVGLVTTFHTLLHQVKIFSAANPAFDCEIPNALFCQPEQDIAILDGGHILPGIYRTLKPENIRPIEPGQGVTILGYPFYNDGDKLSRKSGKITQIKNRFGMTLYAVDIDIKEGESGGPVMNDRGRVVGMVRSTLSDHFIIPISYILDAARQKHPPRALSKWEKDFIAFEGTSGSIFPINNFSPIQTMHTFWRRIRRLLLPRSKI